MDNIIQQGDHLILPYSTLMGFVDKKMEISVLDLNDFNNISVERGRPNSYHKEINYYNPEYDAIVKKRERLIGILFTKLSKVIDEIERGVALSKSFNRDKLKNQIIDIITVEYHRLVIVDNRQIIGV